MTLKDVYDTFPSGCTEDYKILRAFEMGKQTSDKKVRDLEAQIEKMKCCANCVHFDFNEPNYCHKGVYRERQYVCGKWCFGN